MKPSYKYPILAKPSGITLEQHKFNVISEGRALMLYRSCCISKYYAFINKDIEARLALVCEYHDEGKSSDCWQIACQKDHILYMQSKGVSNAKKEIGENIRLCGVRHELYSLDTCVRKRFPLPLIAAIAAHHGKLNVAFRERWEQSQTAKDIWKLLNKKTWENKSFEQISRLQYEYSALRGLLQFADHRASAKEEGDYVPTLTPFSYKFPHPQKRPVQQIIERYWDRDLLLLRAPTGAGKTDASLLWASLQIENKRADRLVVAMPTRFTSNALAINVSDTLSDTGLYHSSAWYSRFQADVNEGNIDKRYAEKEHELARLLETPVTVCTIDHLLMALTLTREDHHLITFNLANSCVVIDEADFYDDFTQANILVLLELLKYWKVPVLLMSASLPESSLEDYRKIGYRELRIEEDKSDGDRDRFELSKIQQYSSVDDIESLLFEMMTVGAGIIYVNTVDKVFEISQWFERQNFKDIIIYHSRFTEPDKKAKEEELIEALGKDAWKEGRQHGIAILTQIGEMSINISADIMLSDLCPIDRLTQRAGRLCRFDKNKVGKLYVVVPVKDDVLYPAPYGTFDKKTTSWEPCASLELTFNLLECKNYSSNDLVKLLNKVYAESSEFSARAIENANNLKDYFMFNWLIGSKEVVQTDDDSTNFWSSRNIPPQDSVYITDENTLCFKSYNHFNEWKLSNAIEVPLYLIEQGIKKYGTIRKIENVRIDDDENFTIYAQVGCYDKENGLDIKKKDNNFL